MIKYAMAGEPAWDGDEYIPPYSVEVFDLETGQRVENVRECNAVEGWIRRMVTNRDGEIIVRDDDVVLERIDGKFELRRIEGPSQWAAPAVAYESRNIKSA